MKSAFNFLLLSLLLIASSAFPGCSSKRSLPAPEVKLLDLAFADSTLLHTNISAVTELRNQHHSEIEIKGITHELEINGVDLGKAYSPEPLRLKPLEAKQIPVTFSLSNMSVLTNLRSMLSRGNLKYSIKSSFFVSWLLGKKTLTSKEEGTLLGGI